MGYYNEISCRIVEHDQAAKCEGALISQFLRSSTSIGANIKEAFYAHGKADFIAKLQIVQIECSESEYWLELLIESGYYNDKTILDKCVNGNYVGGNYNPRSNRL